MSADHLRDSMTYYDCGYTMCGRKECVCCYPENYNGMGPGDVIELAEGHAVAQPSHYQLFADETEAIDVIRSFLTPEEYRGYCKGNFLKYRLRAGEKGDALQDIAKSEVYRNWLNEVIV